MHWQVWFVWVLHRGQMSAVHSRWRAYVYAQHILWKYVYFPLRLFMLWDLPYTFIYIIFLCTDGFMNRLYKVRSFVFFLWWKWLHRLWKQLLHQQYLGRRLSEQVTLKTSFRSKKLKIEKLWWSLFIPKTNIFGRILLQHVCRILDVLSNQLFVQTGLNHFARVANVQKGTSIAPTSSLKSASVRPHIDNILKTYHFT